MILLVDMDAFFASVEQAHHPHLRGRPVIVCGDPERRGVVTAASYEARPFGVRAGMPLAEARRRCPQAAYVAGNPEKYVATSLRLLDLYLRWSPDVEPFSVDEAFVGLPAARTLEEAAAVAGAIQRAIAEEHGLGASIGVGPNKLVAKMASGVRKPRGLTALDEAAFRDTFWPRDVQELWGVGPKLAARLRALGIATVGDLARAPAHALRGAFGVVGAQLREAAHGHDDTPLVPYHRGADAKSMGHEVTLPEDCADRARLEGTLLRLSDQVGRRLRAEGYVGRIVTLKLRNRRFETITRQRALPAHTAECPPMFEAVRALFRAHWTGGAVRLLGVSVSGLERATGGEQAELFAADGRRRRLREAVDRVRDRLGEASVVPLGSLAYRRAPGHVPFGVVGPRIAPAGEASAGERGRGRVWRPSRGNGPFPGAARDVPRGGGEEAR
uniref:DNA polymerase IV n=1 Tax=Eiseniibacteriota bacterium TaxID=2212470 RepID=A0A832I1P5_UNCEI